MVTFMAFVKPFHSCEDQIHLPSFIKKHTMCLVVSMWRMKRYESWWCVFIITHLLKTARMLSLNPVYFQSSFTKQNWQLGCADANIGAFLVICGYHTPWLNDCRLIFLAALRSERYEVSHHQRIMCLSWSWLMMLAIISCQLSNYGAWHRA